MRNANVTFAPTSLEFEALHIAETGELFGFAIRFNGNDQEDTAGIDSVTVPMRLIDAVELGAPLIAHVDHLEGRPVRDWSQLSAAKRPAVSPAKARCVEPSVLGARHANT